MPRRCDRRRVLAALATLLLAVPAPASEPRELLLGAVPLDIPAVMHQRLLPLADYLGRELGRPVRLRLSPDYTQAVSDVAHGTVDLAYLAPVAYLRARAAGAVRPLAGTLTRGQLSMQLVLITRADSPIRHPRDLAGRRFALGDPSAHLQRAVLLDAGVPLERLGSYRYLGSFDNIARAVLNGEFDAGIVKDSTAFRWEERGLRVFHRSPPLPPYNIAAAAHLDEALARRIRAALVRLDPAIPAQAAVLAALDPSYSGFAAISDRDYDAVRRLIGPLPESARVPPR